MISNREEARDLAFHINVPEFLVGNTEQVSCTCLEETIFCIVTG
jgi:hypothetical protein